MTALDDARLLLLLRRRRLLLDYDGTLVPIAQRPEDARPDRELLRLLRLLARSCDVVIVSGRDKDTLDAWLGELPIGMFAEHGLWRRAPHTTAWERTAGAEFDCSSVERVMRAAMAEHRGATMERKSLGVAFHYRNADVDDVTVTVWKRAFAEAAGAAGALLDGDHVIEIVPRGISKALAVGDEAADDVAIFAAGDDVTDRAMLDALPDQRLAATVGDRLPRRALHFASSKELRAFLETLTER